MTEEHHEWNDYISNRDTSTLRRYVIRGLSVCKKCGKVADWDWMKPDCGGKTKKWVKNK